MSKQNEYEAWLQSLPEGFTKMMFDYWELLTQAHDANPRAPYVMELKITPGECGNLNHAEKVKQVPKLELSEQVKSDGKPTRITADEVSKFYHKVKEHKGSLTDLFKEEIDGPEPSGS